MSYELDPGLDVVDAVRTVACDRIDTAIAELDRIGDGDAVDAVHDCRKRCKEFRGLIRLVRPALGDSYRDANDTVRDAARALAASRDAHALLATFDDVVAATPDRRPSAGVGMVRRELARRAAASTDGLRGSDDVTRAVDLLADARRQIDGWSLDASGWEAVEGGVAKTYERGRKALAAAIDEPKAALFHELRKRTKYTWYHVQLLTPTAPSLLGPLADRWHDLADGLGDAHDLAVLAEQLRGDPDAFGGADEVERVQLLLGGHRQLLERRSSALGSRLFADDVECFVGRLGGFWRAHEDWGEEQDVGEISDLYGSSDAAEGLTVDDLRELARTAAITGRSSMRRHDLIAALRAEAVLS